jgi:hypothetical protein
MSWARRLISAGPPAPSTITAWKRACSRANVSSTSGNNERFPDWYAPASSSARGFPSTTS